MILPIIMLLVCILGAIAIFLYLKLFKNRSKKNINYAERSANDFVNVRDIKGNFLYTKNNSVLCFLKITPISIELFSKNEKQNLMRNLTAEMSGNQSEFQFLAVSRPVDISPLIMELTNLLTTTDPIQKQLLKHEIAEMNNYAISGEIVERQFYIVLWDKVDDDMQRDLLNRAKQFSMNFIESNIGCELLTQQEIVRLCNLVNNPAYIHLEDNNTDVSIPTF